MTKRYISLVVEHLRNFDDFILANMKGPEGIKAKILDAAQKISAGQTDEGISAALDLGTLLFLSQKEGNAVLPLATGHDGNGNAHALARVIALNHTLDWLERDGHTETYEAIDLIRKTMAEREWLIGKENMQWLGIAAYTQDRSEERRAFSQVVKGGG